MHKKKIDERKIIDCITKSRTKKAMLHHNVSNEIPYAYSISSWHASTFKIQWKKKKADISCQCVPDI